MKRSLLLFGALSIASFACASDPNKDANDAHNAEFKSDRQTQQNAADYEKKQAVNNAEARTDATIATTNSSDAPKANKKAAAADARLAEDREVARAKAVQRLEKADAKTSELRNVITRAGGKATTQSRDSLQAVDNQRVAVKMSIDQLAASSDDDLKQAKTNADSQLDTLEGYVKMADKEVGKFK